MTPLMTYFDSKRYLSFKKFQPYYELRKQYLPILPEQEAEYEKMFSSQSVRYTFQMKETWLEETFESMDGNYLMFYHEKLNEASYEPFMKTTLEFYGYAFGGVSQVDALEQTIVESLTVFEAFTYELDTIVYRKEDVECYLTITLFEQGNFALKLFEKDDYEDTVKTQLIEDIAKLLDPIVN